MADLGVTGMQYCTHGVHLGGGIRCLNCNPLMPNEGSTLNHQFHATILIRCECHDCTQARYRGSFQFQIDQAMKPPLTIENVNFWCITCGFSTAPCIHLAGSPEAGTQEEK